MNCLLALTTAAVLLAGIHSLRCHNCIEGTYHINGEESTIPNQVKCNESSKFGCEEFEDACSSVSLRFKIIMTGVPGEASTLVKKCWNSTKVDNLCQIEEEKLKEDFADSSINVSSFTTCNGKICKGRDYCNAGKVPGLSLLMGVVSLLCALLGQYY